MKRRGTKRRDGRGKGDGILFSCPYHRQQRDEGQGMPSESLSPLYSFSSFSLVSPFGSTGRRKEKGKETGKEGKGEDEWVGGKGTVRTWPNPSSHSLLYSPASFICRAIIFLFPSLRSYLLGAVTVHIGEVTKEAPNTRTKEMRECGRERNGEKWRQGTSDMTSRTQLPSLCQGRG